MAGSVMLWSVLQQQEGDLVQVAGHVGNDLDYLVDAVAMFEEVCLHRKSPRTASSPPEPR